jgi:hypothetical protein
VPVGGIIGGVVGGVLGLAVIGALAWFMIITKRHRHSQPGSQPQSPVSDSYPPGKTEAYIEQHPQPGLRYPDERNTAGGRLADA